MPEPNTGGAATTGDAQHKPKAKPVEIGDGAAETAQKADSSSEQYKATQKILDEVSMDSLKGLTVIKGNSALLDRAPTAQSEAPAQSSGESVRAAAAVAADPLALIPARTLEHHDASFFKSDLLHDTERVGNVWGNSFSKYMVQGIKAAGQENMQTGEWADKLVTGALIGVTLRTVLPKKGVVRAVAATVMAVNMAKDLVMPFYYGAKDAINAKDDKDLDDASRRVSKGVGNFVVDNAIGLPAAGIGEAGTGALLESRAPRFEAWKTDIFTTDKTKVGRFLNSTADKVDAYTSRVSESIKPTDPEVLARESARQAAANLSPKEKGALLEKAGKEVKAHVERSTFYKYGPKVEPVGAASEAAPTVTALGMTAADRPTGLTASDRPISLGGIRRISSDPEAVLSGSKGADPGAMVEVKSGGQRVSFSQYLNTLEKGKLPVVPAAAPLIDIAASIDHAQTSLTGRQGIVGKVTPTEFTGKPPSTDAGISPDHVNDGDGSALAKKGGGRRGKTGPTDQDGDQTPTRRKKAPGKDKSDPTETPTAKGTETDKTAGTDRTTVKEGATISSPREDLKPAVFAKVAAVAKAVQELWTPEKIKLADARDQFRGPIAATTELSKPVLPAEYKPSTAQLLDLVNQVDNMKNLKAAGMLLMYHMKAANQLLFPQDNVRDLNMMTHELAGVFLTGMRKLGIPEDRLRRIIPSLVTETDDKGSGYFTLPPIDGVLDRPVTVVPRAFTRLISVMTDVIRHESLGHDHTYPELARFPAADRDNLIKGAVAKTMLEEKIPDKAIKMGGETISTSEFMFRLLKAEANENTSDFMGTLSGGIGTPASLGVLLQSLRDGGLLETRNVYGKEFEDGIEPHGIDRWRIKFCAEVMRQLAPKDKTVTEYADALDQYAKEASRPGDTYTWASTDKPGEKVDIPMSHWDAIIPRIVKAQLDTPLDTLKDVSGKKHTLREMLGDNHAQTVKGIDELANQFVDAVRDGKSELPNFDKTKYTIGQVFSAGLVAWMRATRHDVDPVKSLAAIDKISSNLTSQYRESNPNEVPLTTPNSVKLKQTFSQSPSQIMRITGAAVANTAPLFRTAAEKSAGIMGGTATGDVYAASQWLSKEAHEMSARTKEMLGFKLSDSDAPASAPATATVAAPGADRQ